jgi:hypothetical protein
LFRLILLDVFYVLYFNLFTLSLNIFLSDALSSVYGAIVVKRVRVGRAGEPIRQPFRNDTSHMNL